MGKRSMDEQRFAALMREALRDSAFAEAEAVKNAEYGQSIPTIRVMRRRRAARIWRESIPKAAKVAAIALAITGILGTASIAGREFLRVKVMGVDIQWRGEQDIAAIDIYDTGKTVDVPGAWNGAYFPGYIPEGFTLDAVDCNAEYSAVSYSNGEGDYLIVSMGRQNLYFDYDDEKARTTTAWIQGDYGRLVYLKGEYRLLWKTGSQYMAVVSSLPPKSLMQVAKSMILLDY